jgi:hypothetical protein
MALKKSKPKLLQLFEVAQGRQSAINKGQKILYSTSNWLSYLVLPFRVPLLIFRGFFIGFLQARIDKIQKKIMSDYSDDYED